MADEQVAENLQGTPSPEQQTQTQSAQTDPHGITDPGQQAGTPGEVGKVEKPESQEFFQTKYQKAEESRKELLAELDIYRNTFGPLESAQPQPEPIPQAQPALPEEIDLYDPAQFKNYIDAHLSQIRTGMSKAAQEAIVQARRQEQLETEQRESFGKFQQWAQKNEVPDALIGEAMNQFAVRFDPSRSRPSAIVEWVSDYIVKKSSMEQTDRTLAQRQAEAAEKAKLLAGNELPPQGATPGPAPSEQKTPGQQYADDIVPDDPEPEFN